MSSLGHSISRSVKPRPLHRSVRRLTDPSAAPVTIDQVSRALDMPDELDSSTRQELLDLIGEATSLVEHDCRRALMPQTWELRMDAFPRHEIELDFPPVQEAGLTVQYTADETLETLPASEYEIDIYQEPARLRPKFGKQWPRTDRVVGAVLITFSAGWPSREAMPQIAQRAVLMAIKHLHEGCELGEGYHMLINRLRWEGVV